MKRFIASVVAVLCVLGLVGNARAQVNTNSAAQNILNNLVKSAYFDAHVTWAPTAKSSQRLGGGVDLFEPVASTTNGVPVNVFTDIGAQWAYGGAYGITGQVGLDTPLKLLQAFSTTNNDFAAKFTLDPFIKSGLGAPVSGDKIVGLTIPGHNTSTTAVAVEGYGLAASVADINGWRLILAVDAEDWIGQGWIYSGGLVLGKPI
jgi:hypothetical protein